VVLKQLFIPLKKMKNERVGSPTRAKKKKEKKGKDGRS